MALILGALPALYAIYLRINLPDSKSLWRQNGAPFRLEKYHRRLGKTVRKTNDNALDFMVFSCFSYYGMFYGYRASWL